MQVKLSGFGLWEFKHGCTYRTYSQRDTDHAGSHWHATVGYVVKRFLVYLCFMGLPCMGTDG